MHGWDRIYQLHKELQQRRVPVTANTLAEILEVSDRTVRRMIRELRDYLGAPIETSQEPPGYFYADNDLYELPGLWFSAEELQALLTLQQLLKEVQPGLLADTLAPLSEQISGLMQRREIGGGELSKRMRFIALAARPPGSAFNLVTAAVLDRKQLQINYQARGSAATTNRVISPQRLVHYRENWYLDAWCHQRQALRTFAVEKITHLLVLNEAAEDVSEQRLNTELAGGYGIFSGLAEQQAELVFTAERAQWVAAETWHPEQQSEQLADGRFKLIVPYSQPHELVMDILKYAADVEVVAPKALRQLVQEKLRVALAQY